MAFDIITNAHPELLDALQYAVGAVSDAGPGCRSPVRICAEALFSWNTTLNVHGRPSRGTTSRHSYEPTSRGEEAPNGCGFAHSSRDETHAFTGTEASESNVLCQSFAPSIVRQESTRSSMAMAVPPPGAVLPTFPSEPEEEQLLRQRAMQARGRRAVVFSEPVRLDSEWKPTVIEKTPMQRDEILGVIKRNILFCGES